MCYCGAENQCVGINGNFSGCLKLFTWLAKPAADSKTQFCCRGKLQVGSLAAGVYLRVFSCENLTIYPAAQAADLMRWGSLPRGSPRVSVSAALQAARGRCGRPRLAGAQMRDPGHLAGEE